MRFPLIDLLRATAALLVMVFHVVMLGDWKIFNHTALEFPFLFGWIGVDLFLVISGFVITLSAARSYQNALQRGRQPYRWQFMRRRFGRIVPLYVVSSVIFVFLVRPELLSRPTDEFAAIVLSHLFFLQNFWPMTHGVIGGVTWSLALEMQFYVALIFGINQLLRLGPWRTLALLVGVSWFWRWGLTLLLKPAVADSHLQWIYTAQLPGTLDAFGMGITLALVLVRGGQGGLVRLLAPSWPHCVFWLGLSAAMLWASGAVLLQNRNYWEIIGMIVFWRTGLAVGFAAALCAVLSCPLTGTGWLRPFRYLGEISYGLYIWHFPVLLALVTRPDLRGGTLFVLVLAGSVILASLSWHLMEKHWILGSGKV